MILDALLVFADAQVLTNSGASTSVVDTLAKGNAYNGDWIVVLVNTAYTSQGTAAKNTWQIQTSDTEDFSGASPLTLAQSGAYLATQLTAGKMWAVKVPIGVKRYLRVYKLISGNGAADYFTAGKFDAFVTPDISIWSNNRYILQ